MELYRPRGSSIPRNYRQIPAEQRFSVADAAQLKLTLQALDDKIERDVRVQVLKDACQSRPFHEEIYVDGSEEFFLLVKSITRADLIPQVYIEAFESLQQGRYPLNYHRYSDFRKGIDPTFSEVRSLLARIDALCGTKLDESIRNLENEVTPFPFLRLPAELRLQIYAHHLPREDHIALLHRPSRRTAGDRKNPHIDLTIMGASRQLHNEVAKYFYENRTLFIMLARDKGSQMLSDEYMSRYYETLAVMNPGTRQLFTRMEIQVGRFSEQTFVARQPHHAHVQYVTDPMRHVLAYLPNLATFVITFPRKLVRSMPARVRLADQLCDTLEWLLSYIPQESHILWDLSSTPWLPDQSVAEEVKLQEVIGSRGPIKHGDSVTKQFGPDRVR